MPRSYVFAKLRLPVCGALALVALGGCTTSPTVGSFYQVPPGPLRSRPGDLLRSERMSGAPAGNEAYRILYASQGPDGNVIPVSGVVVVPAGSSNARNIVAWAHPTTGIATHCAPSLSSGIFKSIPGLKDMLARRYVVTATDYPGLGTVGPNPYLVGLSEGRAVLDSVRAARQVPGANAGSRCVLWGHSQGGQGVLFAGEIARRYAPELSVVGVAAIAPPTDLETLLRLQLPAHQPLAELAIDGVAEAGARDRRQLCRLQGGERAHPNFAATAAKAPSVASSARSISASV